MIKFNFVRTLGILKGQIEDRKIFPSLGLHPTNSRAEIEKYFVRFLVQEKIVEFGFEIS